MEQYADVIVDLSLEKLDRTFQYRVPERMRGQLAPGVQVRVPFGNGNRRIAGYVLELSDEPAVAPEKMKEIAEIVPESIAAPNRMLELAAWIRTNYGGTMNQALKTVLPVRRAESRKEERTVSLAVPEEKAKEALSECRRKNQTARCRLLEALLREGSISYSKARKDLNLSLPVFEALEEQGVIRVESSRVYRGMPALQGMSSEETVKAVDKGPREAGQRSGAENREVPAGEGTGHPAAGFLEGLNGYSQNGRNGEPFRRKEAGTELNPAQRRIADEIIRNQREGDRRPCLIYGVTGSGKTEIYLELIASAAAEGKPSIVLVPEIALTWQTVRRFTARFGQRVGVLHSRMSQGERFDQYERAQSGEIDVMVGPRSALFTPFSEIGYIILDEEHESSYKSETTPRYHARETAIFRATQCGACVVLGSATPSVESFRRAETGEFHYYELPDRAGGQPMPEVQIEDMRGELRKGNRTMFSDRLRALMEDRLSRGEQTMLFLNRRGMAGFVSCRSCGAVIKCPHCDVSLSLHGSDRLVCHYCGYEQPAAKVCPSCGSKRIGVFRAGTQKIEAAVRGMFPEARVLRMDADTTKRKGSYEKILSAMADRRADILIGTQMIVKGHDFPGVTLVGILAADLSLNAPDYRASERTYQLLVQAAGRAGRGSSPGEVVIQTYQPEHYSIQAAKEQDYPAFYRQEMQFRTLMHYPPAWNMLVIHAASPGEEAAEQMAQSLSAKIGECPDADRQVVGPADAQIAKVRDFYHKVIYVKQAEYEKLVDLKDFLEKEVRRNPLYEKGTVQFDFNPMNGL